MSRLRIITVGVGTLAVLGFSAGPALAYDYSGSSTTGQTTVLGEVKTRPAPVKVAAVQITRDAPTQPAGVLAFTGSDAIIGGLVLGTGLVVVGGGLVVGGRKKRTV